MDLAMSLSRGCWSRSKPLITQRHLRPPKLVVVIKCRKIQILSQHTLRILFPFRNSVNFLKELKNTSGTSCWKDVVVAVAVSIIKNEIEQEEGQGQRQQE